MGNFKYGELGSVYIQKEKVRKTGAEAKLLGTCSYQSEENYESTADETISDGENYGPDTEPMDVSFSQGNEEKDAVVQNGKHSTIEDAVQLTEQKIISEDSKKETSQLENVVVPIKTSPPKAKKRIQLITLSS